MKAKLLFILLIGLILGADVDIKAQSKYGTGQDSIDCITNISLYREFFRQWKDTRYKGETVKDAINPWRKVITECPKATLRAYTDGTKIVSYMINTEKDAEKRELLIDTLMMVYDWRIQNFGREGYVTGRKGIDFYKFRTQDFEQTYNLFKKSVELQKNEAEAPVISYYFRTTIKMVREEKADGTLIVDNYDQIINIIEHNLEKYKSNSKKLEQWQSLKGNIEAEFEPYATCEDLVPLYTRKFEENPSDIVLLQKITDILDSKKCHDSQLYFDASVQLYKLEPSPESAFLIAKMYLREKDYNEALIYLGQATSMEDADKLADAYYYMALCNQQANDYREARKNARLTLDNNPNYGAAYILIGDIYAASAKECGGNDLTNKVAYWAAVDKYYKAKRVDETVAEIANSRINSYAAHFPTTETIFFYNLKEGEDYEVECWINEKTKVRAAK